VVRTSPRLIVRRVVGEPLVAGSGPVHAYPPSVLRVLDLGFGGVVNNVCHADLFAEKKVGSVGLLSLESGETCSARGSRGWIEKNGWVGAGPQTNFGGQDLTEKRTSEFSCDLALHELVKK
jgi:hypothetical protein